jgi:hypothetical protein
MPILMPSLKTISPEKKRMHISLYHSKPEEEKNQRGDNSARIVKIGANLPPNVEESLIRCLKANTDMFVVSPEEMPRIDPKVACHRLNVNPNMRYVAQ